MHETTARYLYVWNYILYIPCKRAREREKQLNTSAARSGIRSPLRAKRERHHVSYRWICFPYKTTFFCTWEDFCTLFEVSTKPSIHPSHGLVTVHCRTCTSSTHSLTLRASLGPPGSLTCLFLDCGRKPEELEKTQPDTGGTRKLLTERPPLRKKCHCNEAWSSFFRGRTWLKIRWANLEAATLLRFARCLVGSWGPSCRPSSWCLINNQSQKWIFALAVVNSVNFRLF